MSKEEILNRMVDEMPFNLNTKTYPYILEAMEIHAQNQVTKTLEDVKVIINKLKEAGYDEVPDNWYVDGKELLKEIETIEI